MTTHFQKTVDIKAVDEEARTATAAVLEPNTLDHQFDFLRPDAVERFHTDDVDTGVLHSAFPTDAATLERSDVLDESETIDGEAFDAGTWVATRRYEDDDLWALVDDGILTGFSIGGSIERAAEHDTLPDDVTVPDSVEHDGDGGTELLDGTVDEISDVDIPAVPGATYKGEQLGKSLLEEVDGEEEFVELMVEQRGHDEADARRLYQYLTDHADTGPKKKDLLAALDVAKQDFPPWPFSEDPSDGFEQCKEDMAGEVDDEAAFCAAWMREALGVGPEELREALAWNRVTNKVDINGTEVDLTPPAAVVNAAEAALEAKRETYADELGDCGSGVGEARSEAIINNDLTPEDFVGGENTAIPDYLDSHSEDVAGIDAPPTDWDEDTWTDGCGPVQYALWGGTATGTGLEWANDTEQEIRNAMEQDSMTEEPDDATKWQKFSSWLTGTDDPSGGEDPDSETGKTTGGGTDEKNAPGSETPNPNVTDNDPGQGDEPPEWAKSLTETVEQNTEKIEDLAARQKTVEIEVDGETTELTEKELREALGENTNSELGKDAPEWAQDLAEKIEQNAEQIDAITEQSGYSKQLDGAGAEPDGEGDEVEAYKAGLVGGGGGD